MTMNLPGNSPSPHLRPQREGCWSVCEKSESSLYSSFVHLSLVCSFELGHQEKGPSIFTCVLSSPWAGFVLSGMWTEAGVGAGGTQLVTPRPSGSATHVLFESIKDELPSLGRSERLNNLPKDTQRTDDRAGI